jgi:hypothetical protein
MAKYTVEELVKGLNDITQLANGFNPWREEDSPMVDSVSDAIIRKLRAGERLEEEVMEEFNATGNIKLLDALDKYEKS